MGCAGARAFLAWALGMLMCFCTGALAAPAEGIAWQSYDQALELAKTQPKPLLIYFRTPWCHQCREMKRKVFSDPQVIERLNRDWIAVDVDLSEEKRLGELFAITHVPTFHLRDPQGRPVLVRRGYVSRDDFLLMLEFVQGGHFQQTTFEEFRDR